MARYQYVAIVGPVCRVAVAASLAWLPSAQQPARGLAPNRLGDVEQPGFDALYKPEGLQWTPADRYAGGLVPPGQRQGGVLDPFPRPEVVYDPAVRDWAPSRADAGRGLAFESVRWIVLDPIPPVDPAQLAWVPSDRYAGRSLRRAAHLDPIAPTRLAPFTLSGVTRDSAGAILGGCTVKLFGTATDVLIATTTSDAGTGAYSFATFALGSTEYYAVAYLAGSPDVAGTTVNTLVST